MKTLLLIFGVLFGVLFCLASFANSFNIFSAKDTFTIIGEIASCLVCFLIGITLVFVSGGMYFEEIEEKQNEKKS